MRIKNFMNELAICILFYEKVDQTIECLQSFIPSKVNIYILNNNSSGKSYNLLRKFCSSYPQIKIFNSRKNKGVAQGRNFLITHTNQAWLIFVDNDVKVLTKNWLTLLVKNMNKYKDTEIFIPSLYNLHENAFVKYTSMIIKKRKIEFEEKAFKRIINLFPGGAVVIKRCFFNRLGLYDMKLFIGFEDVELAIRAFFSGKPLKARLLRKIVFLHHHRRPQTPEDLSSVLVRYDINTLKKSGYYLSRKYPIDFDESWKPWVKNQLKLMLS